MIRKADTIRISLVLENEMLKAIDKYAKQVKMSRSEYLRSLLKTGIMTDSYNGVIHD